MDGVIGSGSARSPDDSSQPHTPQNVAATSFLPTARYKIKTPEPIVEGYFDDQESTRFYAGINDRQSKAWFHTDERYMSAPAKLGTPGGAVSSLQLTFDDYSEYTRIFMSNWDRHSAPPSYELAQHRPYTSIALEETEEDINAGSYAPSVTEARALGTPFKVEWIRTDSLPFVRTRHLRNPWNHSRLIKVARDGTELDPDVARQLFEEWDRPPPVPDTPLSNPPPLSPTKSLGIRSTRR